MRYCIKFLDAYCIFQSTKINIYLSHFDGVLYTKSYPRVCGTLIYACLSALDENLSSVSLSILKLYAQRWTIAFQSHTAPCSWIRWSPPDAPTTTTSTPRSGHERYMHRCTLIPMPKCQNMHIRPRDPAAGCSIMTGTRELVYNATIRRCIVDINNCSTVKPVCNDHLYNKIHYL